MVSSRVRGADPVISQPHQLFSILFDYFFSIGSVQVRLGDWDTASDVDCETVDGTRVCAEPVQDIGIEEMFAHEMYNKPRYANDIGLIRLARRANINSGI